MIGYAPNAFGHSVRLLQILNNFGINKAIIWRRISIIMENKAEFVWQSSGHFTFKIIWQLAVRIK